MLTDSHLLTYLLPSQAAHPAEVRFVLNPSVTHLSPFVCRQPYAISYMPPVMCHPLRATSKTSTVIYDTHDSKSYKINLMITQQIADETIKRG